MAAGSLAADRCDPATAAGHYRAAVPVLDRLELAFDAAQARLATARVLALRSPQLAAFDRIGAPSHADAAAELLRSQRA